MRYAAHLRTSKRRNILQSRLKSGLVAAAALALAGAIVFGLARTSHLDLTVFLTGFLYSLFRTSTAYVISLVLAVTIALFITSNTFIENLLLPVFDVLQSFPSFALFPILVVALEHYPEVVIISVLVITMVWPILFAIIGGLKNRREDLEEAATIFGATGFKRLRSFTIPELMPTIVTGSIVGWGEGWEFIIGAELLVHAQHGVGSYLGDLGEAHQQALLAAGIVLLMILLFVINKLVWLPLLHRTTKFQSDS
jgi:NitT/TauT family transport system permease protein